MRSTCATARAPRRGPRPANYALLDALGHLRYAHQRPGNLIEKLIGVFFFGQGGLQQLNGHHMELLRQVPSRDAGPSIGGSSPPHLAALVKQLETQEQEAAQHVSSGRVRRMSAGRCARGH